jgi:PAS domain S-box-containing protein
MVDDAGNIVLVNTEVERLFGYPREELLGRPVETLVPERFRSRHPVDRVGFFRDPTVRAMGAGRELFGLRKDGTEFPVEIGLTPVATAEGLFVISSIVDISARRRAEDQQRRLEEQLRQAQKLEAMGTLAGGVAHDFNNILGSIIGFAELARESAVGAGVSDAVADMDEVLRSAMRGRELVQRILRFSRRQETERKPIDLSQVIRETVGLLRATLPASIELRLRVPPSVPRAMADASSVQQVLMNLATNSSHAMPDGGTLEIGLEPFYVRDSMARAHPALREGPHVLVTVRDNGAGMDPTVQSRAFEPFFTTKPPGSGSGLGLAMVHGIMRDHHGDVALSSTPGQGTSVLCYFPAAELESPEAELSAGDVPRGRGEHVLYVDDEPTLTETGRRRLVALGYTVTAATDPIRALEMVRGVPARFDLVITDYSMPRMNGVELARMLHAARPDLPIVVLTGFLEDFPSDELRLAGVSRLVKKPVTGADLGRLVHELIHREGSAQS